MLGVRTDRRRAQEATARTAALLVGLLIHLNGALAASSVGSVTRLEGDAEGIVTGSPSCLAVGASVFSGEVISTGPAARLEITLVDRTALTLGERARLTIDDFVFHPAGAIHLDLAVTGAFRFVSGRLAAVATREANVRTPFATIGVRGTDFWGGPIDGHFGVVVLSGAVTVSHRGRAVALRAPGSGVDLAGLNATPGPVHPWAAAKIDRAIQTIAFH